MPLHIFEPRYRQMTEDLLDTAGRLVIANVRENSRGDMAGSPDVHPIAGLGEISGHERLEDGRFLIALIGLARVRLEEVESDKPYRMVDVHEFEESDPEGDEAEDIRKELLALLSSKSQSDMSLPDDLKIGQLVDALLLQLSIPPSRMQNLFETPDIAMRAREAMALAAESTDNTED